MKIKIKVFHNEFVRSRGVLIYDACKNETKVKFSVYKGIGYWYFSNEWYAIPSSGKQFYFS